MKKWLKRIALIVVLVLFLSPFLLYGGIVIGNDMVANQVEKDLTSCPLPAESVLVDSLSAAGKFVGNGNGMQYIGAILIISDLSKEDILKHYQNKFEYIEVYRQTSPTIQSLSPNDFRYEKLDPGSNETYYSVLCWGSNRDYVPDDIAGLLDFDLRGH